MITRDNLPKNYVPFEKVTICSNSLIGGGNLVAVGDVLPLLIGRGDKPKIWLQAVGDAKQGKFTTIVEESISKHPNVKVFEESDYLKVMISDVVVLNVKLMDESSAEIDILDFRPIGLNMHGNSSALITGGGTFANNSMHGAGTLIGFGA